MRKTKFTSVLKAGAIIFCAFLFFIISIRWHNNLTEDRGIRFATSGAFLINSIAGEPGGNFGRSAIAGNFFGNDQDDLAIGASLYQNGSGRVYVFSGTDIFHVEKAGSSTSIITGENGENFGVSLDCGDINGDGVDDLAVGAYLSDKGRGQVYIFYGGKKFPKNSREADIIISGENQGDFFGIAVKTVESFISDKDDLAIGADGYRKGQGAVYLFRNGEIASGSAASANRKIIGETGSFFGVSLAFPDLNRDGRPDLTAGAYYYNKNQGRVYVFYNQNEIPQLASAADSVITGELGSNFGRTLAAGDLDGDDYYDLVVGAWSYHNESGRVYTFYSKGFLPDKVSQAEHLISGESASRFGWSILVGEKKFNNTGLLAVGASWHEGLRGRSYLFPSYAPYPDNAAQAKLIFEGTENSGFGHSLAFLPVRGAGSAYLVIGAHVYRQKQEERSGKIFIYKLPSGISAVY